MRVRRSKRVSGSGMREPDGRVVSLERRCSALEHDVGLLRIDDRLRELARRLTAVEGANDQRD